MNEQTQRFTVADGIVTDTTTGLQWSQDDVTESRVNWQEADEACKGLRIGGFEDWRLPTVDELFALADRSRFDPAIDVEAFPSGKSEWYWTATPDAEDPSDYAWFVHFRNGYAGCDSRSCCGGRVRAVRGSSRQ